MTAIDGILKPKKTSLNATPSQIVGTVKTEKSVSSYELLALSMDRLIDWVESSHTIRSHVRNFDSIAPATQSMGVTATTVGSIAKTVTQVLVMQDKMAEYSRNLRFYLVSFSTWVLFAVNTLTYKLYIAAHELVDLTASMPRRFRRSLLSIQEFAYILNTPDLRELAFLEWKLSTKLFLSKLQTWVTSLGQLSKKFYLAAMVAGSLLAMSIANVTGGNFSFLQAATARHAIITDTAVSGVGGSSLISRDILKWVKTNLKSYVIEHTVEPGQDVKYLAGLYNVSEETIQYNNNITGSEVEVGKKVYIPPVNAYIQIAEKDVKPEEIASVYKISAADLKEYNPEMKETGEVHKGDVSIIPLSDFGLVKQYQAEEAARQKEVAAKEQAAKFRAQALAGVAYRKLDFLKPEIIADLNFSSPVGPGLALATTYPGHANQGTDFGMAGVAGTGALAINDGTVIEVKSGCSTLPSICGAHNGFYGNFVTIDHGNGYKSRYAHLASVAVGIGDKVARGQSLGTIGQSGNSTGIHLHFEIIKDDFGGIRADFLIPSVRVVGYYR